MGEQWQVKTKMESLVTDIVSTIHGQYKKLWYYVYIYIYVFSLQNSACIMAAYERKISWCNIFKKKKRQRETLLGSSYISVSILIKNNY
jgi:hypothetical protein